METQDIKTLRAKCAKEVETKKAVYEKLRDAHAKFTSDFKAQETKLTAELRVAEAELRTAGKELVDFDKVFGERLSANGTPKSKAKASAEAAPVAATPAKRGPKPKVKPAAATQASPTAEPKRRGRPPKVKVVGEAVAPKTPKASAKARNEGQSRAAAGRRAVALRERPPLKNAIAEALGNKTLSAQEVYEILEARQQLPNADRPRVYVGYVLSANEDLYERATDKRGFYRLSPLGKTTLLESAPGGKNSGPKENGSAKAASKAPEIDGNALSTDEILNEVGIGSGGTLFEDASA